MNRLLITAACTLAFAAGSSFANDNDHAKDRAAKATTSAEATGDSVGDKMKRGAHRMGDKMRHMGRKAEDKVGKAKSDDDRKTAQEAGADARAMGASGSSSMGGGDRARQERMDQAYNDYKSKSGSSSTSR